MTSNVDQLKLLVLFEISQILGQALRLTQALDAILGILSRSLAMEKGTVTLLDPEHGHLVILSSHGLSPEERRKGVYRTDEGVTGRVFATGKPFVVPDVRKEPLFLNRTGARNLDIGLSFIGVPILLDGQPVGVLSVDRLFGHGVSLDEDAQFLSIIATLIAQMVRLNDEVKAREQNLVRSQDHLREEISDKYQNFFMVKRSSAMEEVGKLIRKVAPTRASVLLLGESGTGKTLIARILHELSPRSKLPFIKVNCAALPENLLESELFGYERGAFTGAIHSKPGRIEQAEGGTIFLDEVGEFPLTLQAKLLRFLQEREIERLGSNRTITVDVRIIAATNRNLAAAVEAGTLRSDLFYRLNVFPVHVPPLRERPEDILPLLQHFLSKFSTEYGRRLQLSSAASAALSAHLWPGNVREMENLVERLAILVDGREIGLSDVKPYLHEREAPSLALRPLGAVAQPITGGLKEMERQQIVAALDRNGWVLARAARELRLTERQMGYRVKILGLRKPDPLAALAPKR